MGKGTKKDSALLTVPAIGSEQSESLWESVEKTYKSSERRYRLLAENVTDVIWTMDMEYRFTYISPSVIHMRGYSADEAMFQSMAEVYTPSSYLQILQAINEGLPAGSVNENNKVQSKILELYQICKDGTIICTETKLSYLRDHNEEAIGILGVTRDVTERKRMEEQLKHSELLASLGKMTAGIAHEVNNPLGSILLFSELMMKSEISHEVKKDLRVIHDEAKRAAKVMSDLLTYSLGGSNKVARLNLENVITKVCEMRLYAETVKNINVMVNFPPRPLIVFGDKSQLAQVFMNIMLNAEEALEENNGGNIFITATVSNEWVKIAIADDGIGIPEENISQIFYPFYTTKGIGEGTGLGLSTCYGIITSHGGLIHAENNNMSGVTIVIDLPLAKYE
ncbi:MAG: PAS domain S-box protein [Dehalococcoidales bacterium]|nr:PAS domain S-box protein [Dehalococcoidales bacterium]